MSIVNLENKTILVTGAAGFIGSNLVKRIYQEAPSATVIGIDNMNAYYYKGMSQYEIADELGIRQQSVDRILKQAVNRLRKNF